MTTDKFHLGDLLSVTTGVLLSPDHMGGVYRILQHMTGEPLWTHQLPRTCDECTPALIAQYPFLATITVPEFPDPAAVLPWLEGLTAVYGDSFEVQPLDPEDHTHIDPLLEMALLRPDAEVIPVVLGSEGGAE